MPITLYGADYSVYTRIARLALLEKGVPYRLEPVDVFAPGGPPPDHLARQPFGRIPAFRHDDFPLYEAGAIVRYVDDAFDGPSLQPATAKGRARMNQIISVLDSYAFASLVLGVYVERIGHPARGVPADEAKLAAATLRAAQCLDALAGLADAPFLTGEHLSLADLHAAPMFAYFVLAPEGQAMLARHDRLAAWWARLAARPSVVATRTPMERKISPA